MRSRIQLGIEIDLVAFGPEGLTLMVAGWDKPSLVLDLFEGWVGEFVRMSPTSPLFSLRQARPATDQDRRQSACVLNVLWRRPGSDLTDRAIAACLTLAHQTPEFATPASNGADHHES